MHRYCSACFPLFLTARVGYFRNQVKHDQQVSFCLKDLNVGQTRKIVEHVSLIRTTNNLTENEEKDMLDFLYTTQYQMRGILSVSLGRISGNSGVYTHGISMRFQSKADVAMFYENSFYLRVVNKYVTPYCDEMIHIDYEAEVEDDIVPLFRKGEEYNSGVEFVHLFQFEESAAADEALSSLESITKENMSLVVQFTKGMVSQTLMFSLQKSGCVGSNFNGSAGRYTHGTLTRFRSPEAFRMFVASARYQAWNFEFQPIMKGSLPLYYVVDPIAEQRF